MPSDFRIDGLEQDARALCTPTELGERADLRAARARIEIAERGVTEKPGRPDSVRVGTFGRSGARVGLVTARVRTLPPAFTCGSISAIGLKIICTCPPNNATSAGAPPLNGTCSKLIFVCEMNSSTVRCVIVPDPADE